MKREPAPMVTHNGNRYTQAELRKLAGKQRKKPRAKLPPSHEPHDCTVLAVDAAKISGVALYERGGYVNSYAISKDDDRMLLKLCRWAIDTARINGIPCVLVLEKPPPFVYAGRGASTMLGLGAAREAWERAWRDTGGKRAHIVRVEPNDWRKPVLGCTRAADLPMLERARANQISAKVITTQDEAAAICIGHWAVFAGEVGAVLPKIRPAALANETALAKPRAAGSKFRKDV